MFAVLMRTDAGGRMGRPKQRGGYFVHTNAALRQVVYPKAHNHSGFGTVSNFNVIRIKAVGEPISKKLE